MELASGTERGKSGTLTSTGSFCSVHPHAVEADDGSTLREVKTEQADGQGDVEAPGTPTTTSAIPDVDAILDVECPQRPSIYDDFTSSFPDGLAFWKSFLVTFCVCVIAGTLQFVVIPNSNPLHDKQRKGIWHCGVGCAIVWIPISMLYIVFMTGRWVIRDTGVTLKLTDMFIMWPFAAFFFIGSVIFWNSVWTYPFPFGGFPSSTGGLVALGSAMWVMLYRRFKQRGLSSEQFRTCLFKGVMVFVVFVYSLIILVLLMMVLGASQYVPAWACALSFPAVRYIVKRVSEVLLRFIDDEATIVAENLTMTSFGIGLTLLIGNTGNAYFAIVIAFLDIACGMATAVQMRDNALLRAFLRLRLLGRRPTEAHIQRAIQVGKATFIASEVGEVIVPITYVVVFSIIYAGPYSAAFTGIGTAEFGVKPPAGMRSFIQTMAVLIAGDTVGTIILKFLVHYATGLDTIREMREFYRRYGMILTIQTIWIIHTAFCAVMLLCGLDYSFKLEFMDLREELGDTQEELAKVKEKAKRQTQRELQQGPSDEAAQLRAELQTVREQLARRESQAEDEAAQLRAELQAAEEQIARREAQAEEEAVQVREALELAREQLTRRGGKAEEEAALMQVELEAAREELARRGGQAEEEAVRLRAELEAAREKLARQGGQAEEEVARLRAELEAARKELSRRDQEKREPPRQVSTEAPEQEGVKISALGQVPLEAGGIAKALAFTFDNAINAIDMVQSELERLGAPPP